ncbi:MAG TPA: protein kinase [Streptosporangiaceae bacterium]|nr:protein kinase [Streptosporangiaceae bacterium]
MGEVWRATDLVLGRPVAVKLLRTEYAQHPEVLARFRAEARHAGSVSNPGIAQVYDYGEDGAAASPYLVLELVDGPSLARVLAGGPLAPADAMDVIAQAAAGLQAAHAAGLVHRDIKPGNLLVGPSGQVKITDFGIAHAAWSAPITQTGALVGTPAYLAPERVVGGPATPASDLYSLGVVGYQCLTGAVPFEGIPYEVTAAHRHRTLPPLPPAVPAEVAELILDLTARDPADRPASAGEVAMRAGRLRDGLAGRPAAAPPAGEPGGPLSAMAMGAEPVTLAGGPVPLPGDPVPLAGGPVPRAGEPVPLAGEPVPWAEGPLHLAGGPVPGAGDPATLADASPPDMVPAHRRPRPGRMRPARGLVLAVAGVAVVAGLAGWLLAGAFGAGPQRAQPGGPQPAAGTPPGPGARSVEVNADALAGQQARAVMRQLRQMGLRPRVVGAVRGGQVPGTVISVQPSGQVPAGSIVTVTAARPPPGQGSGDGNGQGNNGD